MRIGWLADEVALPGGAEFAARRLWYDAPEDVELVYVKPGVPRVDPPLDAYVVHNCISYGRNILAELLGAPVVKVVHDLWPQGDPALRELLLLGSALVVFSSPLHRESFPWTVLAPDVLIPPACELSAFRNASEAFLGERKGTLWLGNMLGPHKGLTAAVEWARIHGPVDFYGAGDPPIQEAGAVYYRGPVPHEEVPDVMARYERFLFLPSAVEPFGLTVVEAAASGLRLTLNDRVGASWWLQKRPEDIERGSELFWAAALEAISRR